ncbi:hypothetical protein JCM8115_003785 [Rhodotorula mucilaginosa]
MGLGETIQGISLMLYLYHERKQFGPFLVVVPLSTLPTSQEQLAKWAPALYTVAPPTFNVLLTTYEMVLRDQHELSRYTWQYLVVDEVAKVCARSAVDIA